MLEQLRPGIYLESIYQLNLDALRQRGIRGLILDIDNTLVPWAEVNASAELLDWLKAIHEAGLRACLLSNNTRHRVNAFAAVTGIPSVFAGHKPARRAYGAALAALGTTAAETAALGDQLYPDVIGANRMGILSILVVPISEQEFLGTRLKRLVERPLLRALARRGWLTQE